MKYQDFALKPFSFCIQVKQHPQTGMHHVIAILTGDAKKYKIKQIRILAHIYLRNKETQHKNNFACLNDGFAKSLFENFLLSIYSM